MGLKSDYEVFIAKSRYAKWDKTSGRREDWEETVGRYFRFFKERLEGGMFTEDTARLLRKAEKAVLETEVMPSMRSLMCAGEALDRDNIAGFNCSYLAVDEPRSFDEAMYVLMCGTGVGFSCERQYIAKLPIIQEPDERAAILREEVDNENMQDLIDSMDNVRLRDSYLPASFTGVERKELSYLDDNVIRVADSKYGWASALRILIVELYNCNFDIKWDVSTVRPAGARLKTFGGRASGADPLVSLFKFAVEVFKKAEGRKLTSIEVHDMMCKVADVVVVGGVRRSALISLSNLTDQRMSKAKSGAWWEDNGQRALANNSVCYTEKPDMSAFMAEWSNLYESKSGERGIFSRAASERQAAKNGRRAGYADFGTNPCSEIILRSKQLCNLSEVVVRDGDTFDSLRGKVQLAAILGTLQATLTDFRYLSPVWKQNTEEEALLGVSLTGIMDNEMLSATRATTEFYVKDYSEGGWPSLEDILEELKEIAVETNKEWAANLGINQSVAITCVKPSGTVSQLVDSASGIHPRHASYYVRTVRQDNKDPLTEFLKAQGVPWEACVMKPESTTIFSFPMAAPEGAIMRDDRTALEQLELWSTYQKHWCEHKPSITVYVKEHEWMAVGAWVYENFDDVSGVSFLPFNDHTYQQAPYQDSTKEEYDVMKAAMPTIDWGELQDYEQEDNTVSAQTLACVSGVCEI
jgi:ribonucleoside-triphosphate reductase